MKKSVLIAAAIASMGLGSTGGITTGSVGVVDTQSSSVHQSKATTNHKAKARSGAKVARLSTGYRHKSYWLIPVNKESFKQSRRKQLKLRAKTKAKRNGQA